MIKKLYSIRDQKSETFNPPFLQHSHGEAERTFGELANDTKTQIGKHPTDYDLYYLGQFDTNSGKFELLDAPEHHIAAINVRTLQPPFPGV